MAKTLREPPPSSSVARLLDQHAASRAIATPLPLRSEGTASLTTQPSENMLVKREFILSVEADDVLSRLVRSFRDATRTRLGASHVLRAMLQAVSVAMPTLEHEIRRLTPTKLPSNARGFEAERAAFEKLLADTFAAGIKGP